MIRPPAVMFGIPIDDVTMTETIGLIDEMVVRGRRDARTHQIATVNVDFLVNAFESPELRAILRGADICVPDGTAVVWAARLLGMPIRERVAGADLVPLLVEASVRTGWKIHVFGSEPDVASRALSIFAERYPAARVSIDAGHVVADPEHVDDHVLDAIATADADILCVALGNPKQERFIEANRDRLGAPVMIGIGGSLDMLVGERRRAPVWVQRIGMEWFARAIQEPRRLGRRYAHDIRVFGPRLAREWRAARRRRNRPGIGITTSDRAVRVDVGGAGMPSLGAWSEAAARLADRAELRVEVASETSSRDAVVSRDAAAAMLVGLLRIARRAGGRVHWPGDIAVSTPVLEASGLTPDDLGRDREPD